jgi:putative redox protein
MASAHKRPVVVAESGDGTYGQSVTIGPHKMRADEAESVGGRDVGPSPYEYVMSGLGACTAMTLRMYASRHGWPLEKVSVEVHHKKVVSPDGVKQTDRFERVIDLKGDLTDEQRNYLVEVAKECPVSQTLQRASRIVTSLAEMPDQHDTRSLA